MFSRWFFFVFKQKTAYEMRISDWSSDVCSSDLIVGAELGARLFESLGQFGLGLCDAGFVPDLRLVERRPLTAGRLDPGCCVAVVQDRLVHWHSSLLAPRK